MSTYLSVYWKGRVLPFAGLSPNAYDGWVGPELEARKLFRVSHLVSETQSLEPFPWLLTVHVSSRNLGLGEQASQAASTPPCVHISGTFYRIIPLLQSCYQTPKIRFYIGTGLSSNLV